MHSHPAPKSSGCLRGLPQRRDSSSGSTLPSRSPREEGPSPTRPPPPNRRFLPSYPTPELSSSTVCATPARDRDTQFPPSPQTKSFRCPTRPLCPTAIDPHCWPLISDMPPASNSARRYHSPTTSEEKLHRCPTDSRDIRSASGLAPRLRRLPTPESRGLHAGISQVSS